jgi:RNA polymerase sigma-70 factor (ECF subfamily)
MDAQQTQPESYRNALRVFCYRMLASLRKADEVANDAICLVGSQPDDLSAGNMLEDLLFRQAVQACLMETTASPRRTLPALVSSPADPAREPTPPCQSDAWLEPFPDEWVPDGESGENSRYGVRESISLTLIAALQTIPPFARAAHILVDICSLQTDRAAKVVGLDRVRYRRLLNEARREMERTYDAKLGRQEPPPQDRSMELSMRYLYSWETADLAAFLKRLTETVVWQMPPSPSWFRGRESLRNWAARNVLNDDARGRWRLLPRRSNGQLAFGLYQLCPSTATYHAHSLQILRFAGELVSEIISFVDTTLFPFYGLLSEYAFQGYNNWRGSITSAGRKGG